MAQSERPAFQQMTGHVDWSDRDGAGARWVVWSSEETMAPKRKIRVGVLFGGRSGEHEISLRSALTVMSAMDPERYEIVPIGIGRDGRWYLRNDAIAMLRQATPKLRALGRGGMAVSLLPEPQG